MKLTIGYVGLTHLGVNYAIASAMKGFNIVCYDDDLDVISTLKKKRIPFYEKGTEKHLKKNFNKFFLLIKFHTCKAVTRYLFLKMFQQIQMEKVIY